MKKIEYKIAITVDQEINSNQLEPMAKAIANALKVAEKFGGGIMPDLKVKEVELSHILNVKVKEEIK